ncbi:hypothetical protein PtrM4_007730 [Pyrenophora tritici-repentis]|uniref:Uncharacterized protein n=1 Tax=Pyrenophora tritici-repentis TaxID=45151 RepID=A0A834VUQ0_9PLEO|nr:hypothetical protein PtrM4_007730 [Pyrenophora tritici-repentis]
MPIPLLNAALRPLLTADYDDQEIHKKCCRRGNGPLGSV